MSRKPPVPASNNIQDSEEALSVLVNVAVTLLSQCIEFLDQGVTDAQLSRESKLSPGATIGKHLRHLLDYYRPLANAAHSTPEGQVLSFTYDKRSRNTPAETSVSSAKNALSDLRKSLLDLPSTVKLARKVRLEATTPFLLTVDSTFGRELWFASLHSIHHLALIRVIAASEVELKIPENFGVAPSTLVFRERNSKL